MDAEALGLVRPPEQIVEEAMKAAKALAAVLDQSTRRRLTLDGEQFLYLEDWATLARFFGVVVRTTACRYVEHGPAKGYEATADAVHVASGRVVSSGSAVCLTDEPKWRDYPVLDDHGDVRSYEPVWLFKVASMAQTRAQSKALATAFRWVARLAGLAGTPAEEAEDRQGKGKPVGRPAAPAKPAARKAAEAPKPAAPAKPAEPSPWAEERDVKRMWAIARGAGWDRQAVLDQLEIDGIPDERKIPRGQVAGLCDFFRKPKPAASTQTEVPHA